MELTHLNDSSLHLVYSNPSKREIMAPLVLKQLSILLWKSWIIRKRHWISAIFEFIFPLLVVLLLVYPRYAGTKQYSVPKPNDQTSLQSPTYFDDKAINYKIGQLFQSQTHIYYAPNNSFTEGVIKQLVKYNQLVNVTALHNEDELFARLLTTNSYSNVHGLVFLNDENDKNNINFKIRMKDFYISTVASLIFPSKMSSGPSDSGNGASNAYDKENSYESSNSFSTIQIAVSEAYLNYISNENRKDTNVSVVTTHQMPYPQYLRDTISGGFNFMNIIGIIFVPAYIVICPLIVKRITDEKVAKAKEMLRMMGMSDWVFWGSHFINFFSIMSVQSLIITLLFFYGFGGLPYFLWSNGFLFFIAMILFNINTILSSMFLTTIFNRPVIAVVVSVILFEISQSVPMALLNPAFKGSTYEPDTTLMALSCFLPNMGIQWVMTLMGNTELYGHGISWNNFWEKTQLYGNFTLGYVMLLMLLSVFFYAFLIWYVDNIWPFQYGIPKPFYYPFLPSYWLSNSKESSISFETKQLTGNPEYFEREPNMRVGIKCQNLQKIFNKKSAVNDVSLNIFSGQITVLLGHNGAGKTTTMNMITGIFPPSDGTAFIDGFDIRQQTKKARRSMALCPQENILYNELNVYEHLKLYAVLKDHPLNDVDNEVNKTLQMIGLSDKRNALSTDLSGGMKRKLCLGIAIIANSQILVLDEPTSGMDPEARRHMWDVLQSIRSQRTILLTTHYMEEADALGDRIAIMNEGQVKCCGTPMFLKKTFGAGYHLRISKNDNFRKERVLSIVRNYMPNAEIKSEIHSEVIYTLESDDINQNSETNKNTSSVLAQMFGDLESRKTELDINSCGLTVTTMEDVFLRVGNEYNDNEMLERNGVNNSDKESLFQSIPKNTGNTLHFQQFKALLFKRFHYAKRYWPMVVLQSVLPAILFMCVLLLDSTMKDAFKQNVVNRQLTLKPLYGNTEGFVSFDSDLQTKFEKIYSEIAKSEGVSTQVITENPNNWTLDDNRGKDLIKYIKTYLIGAQFNSTPDGSQLHLVPWYNKEASQTLPPSINILYKSLLKQLVQTEKTSITVHNHPIPMDDSGSQIGIVQITLIISCLLLIPLTVPFIGASYVLFPVHERVSNSKLLQLMNGLSSIIFWSASYLFDIINHLFASIFIFIVFIIFDWNKVFWGNASSRTALFFMIFLFGFASIPLAYLMSLRLKKPSTGYALLVVIYLLTGLILVMALGMLDMFINTFKYDIMSQQSFEVILFFARLLPVFAMSFGLQKIYKVGSYQLACDQTQPEYLKARCYKLDYKNNTLLKENPLWGCCKNLCEETNECYYQLNALNWDAHGVAFEFTCLIITGALYLFILWFIEENIFEKIKNSFFKPVVSHNQSLVLNMVTGQWGQPQEDSDVFHEKQRINSLVNNSKFKEEAIVVKDLSKRFGKLIPIQAVNHLSFAVHKEECFGLLGVNGAGKTTTFRMLTGDESISEGNAWIEDLNIRQELRQFQKQIGYCPQFDALLDKMTGTETLYMFCRLRGMPEYMISSYVNELVEMVDLQKHVNKRTETYSGGNRRKLSLAIALCAAPPVIFLDEPTSGVDPSARRKIWTTLAYLQERYGSAFILTSHSMEECEALCSRLAIMVNGEFQCLGSVQHLRSKFGQGFTVMAKLRRDLVEQPQYIIELQNYFREQLPSAVLKDIHQCLLHYHITDTSMLWSKMFAVMEEIKTKYFLEDYIISDTTLEQIFLAFARRQR